MARKRESRSFVLSGCFLQHFCIGIYAIDAAVHLVLRKYFHMQLNLCTCSGINLAVYNGQLLTEKCQVYDCQHECGEIAVKSQNLIDLSTVTDAGMDEKTSHRLIASTRKKLTAYTDPDPDIAV